MRSCVCLYVCVSVCVSQLQSITRYQASWCVTTLSCDPHWVCGFSVSCSFCRRNWDITGWTHSPSEDLSRGSFSTDQLIMLTSYTKRNIESLFKNDYLLMYPPCNSVYNNNNRVKYIHKHLYISTNIFVLIYKFFQIFQWQNKPAVLQ